MSGWANIFPRIGSVSIIVLILGAVLHSPVLANYDKCASIQRDGKDFNFFQNVFILIGVIGIMKKFNDPNLSQRPILY